MNNKIEIDVIIPVYNGARFLEDAVVSAVSQTLAPNRIIICDDGSTDETPELAKELCKKFRSVEYLSLVHGGEAAARNAGLRVASSAYVAFLDSDDIWMPSKLQIQMDVFMNADPMVGAVHCGYCMVDEHGVGLTGSYMAEPTKRGDIFWDLLINEYAVTGSASAVMVRRDVIDRVGFFDERLFHGADADMWLRLARVCHFDFSAETLVALRVHANSVQRQNARQRAADFFIQQLMYYEKWETEADKCPAFYLMLRRRALLFMLPCITTPSLIENFYHKVWGTKGSLVEKFFFKNRFELWYSLLGVLIRYMFWRMHTLFANDKGRFNG